MYDEDREVLLTKMQDEAVGGLVVGVNYASTEKAIALVEKHDQLWASAGLHPNDTEKEEFDEKLFKEFLTHPKIVAIGECGLDNYRLPAGKAGPEDPEKTKAKQREVFEKHVQLAIGAEKPLMIHARPTKGTNDAYQDLIEILTSYKKEHGDKLRGDVHFFVGGIEEARALIGLDFTLSFTAVLTFTHDYDDVVKFAPLASLLSETDSPYIAPAGRRGTRNDPLAVKDVVATISVIRDQDEEHVRAALIENARRVFGI
jgi:TatD DNase family protein